MHARKNPRWVTVEPRAFYGIGELTKLANCSRHQLRRVLRTHDVELLRSGRAVFVPLGEILGKIPRLWESFRLIEDLWRGDCEKRLARPGAPGAPGPQG